MTMRRVMAMLAAAVLATTAAAAKADVVTYTVDPARSSLTLSGSYLAQGQSPLPMELPQFTSTEPIDGTPALITSYSGAIPSASTISRRM